MTPHSDTEYEFIEEAQTPFTAVLTELLGLAEKANNHRVDTPTLNEFVPEQSEEAYCLAAFSSVGQPSSCFNVDVEEVLVHITTLDGASRRYVPAALRARVLYLSNKSLSGSHLDERWMYYSMCSELYSPRMSNDGYFTVRDYHSCAKNRIPGKRKRQLKIIYSDRPLDFVETDILGPPSQSKQGNMFVLVAIGRYTKLSKAIPTSTKTATTLARTFLEQCASNYGIPSVLLTNKGPQISLSFRVTLQYATRK